MGTVVAAWPVALIRYAVRQGADRKSLLAATGLTDTELDDPDGRITTAQHAALWHEVERVLRDPELGLHFATSLHSARAFGMIGYLSRAARTWAEVLTQIVRYHPVVGFAGASLATRKNVTTLTLELHTDARQPAEAALATLVVMSRLATGTQLTPLEVRLRHARPPKTEALERLFGCPLFFGASTWALDYGPEQLATKLVSADPALEQYLEEIAAKHLEKAGAKGLSAEVSDAITRALPHGAPSLTQVGKNVGHSSRSLQRKLKDEGTTFATLLEGVRSRLALELMESDRLTLSEIATRLGFSDDSAFRRAFKRWQGTSPREERRRRRGKA